MVHFNSNTGETERILVVAGGSKHQFTALSAVDLLYLDSYEAGTSDGWVPGPRLPESGEQTTMHDVEDGVIIVGGYNGLGGNSLYKLTPTFDRWEMLPQKLKQFRWFHTSILVPDEVVACHQ